MIGGSDESTDEGGLGDEIIAMEIESHDLIDISQRGQISIQLEQRQRQCNALVRLTLGAASPASDPALPFSDLPSCVLLKVLNER